MILQAGWCVARLLENIVSCQISSFKIITMRQIPGKYHPMTLLDQSGSDNKAFWSTDLDVKFGQEKSTTMIWTFSVMAGKKSTTDTNDAHFMAPWGESMLVQHGDYLVMSIPEEVMRFIASNAPSLSIPILLNLDHQQKLQKLKNLPCFVL
jgi:hypothetical protein